MTSRIPKPSFVVPPRSQAATAGAAKPSSAQRAPVTQDSRFSSDFRSWLFAHGYGKYDWAKGDLPSFGGKDSAQDTVGHEPVIFIHGNGGNATDWNDSVQYFEKQGYKPSELYGLTWGPGDLSQVGFTTHTAKNEKDVRAFIEAVEQYTGAKKVNIVSHSMGVTLARKAILGGKGVATDGKYNLGPSLSNSVDTFVGIAGANQGLISAWELPTAPVSNPIDGFYPGTLGFDGQVHGQSKFLQDINSKQHYEGDHVFSIWSPIDEVVNFGDEAAQDLVWGVNTSEIPGEDGTAEFALGHFGLQTQTAEEQFKMITEHEE